MTLRKIYEVENNQVVINLPKTFRNKKRILVIVNDTFDSKSEKKAEMKKAAKDPLFLEDIEEVNNDFNSIDHEGL